MKTDVVKMIISAACAASMAFVALMLWFSGEPHAAYLTAWMTAGSSGYTLLLAWKGER